MICEEDFSEGNGLYLILHLL